MEPTPTTSFIPKQGSGQIPQAPIRRRTRFNFIGFIAVVLFLGSVFLAAGAFMFQRVTVKDLEASKVELARLKASFESGSIEAVSALDARMKTAGFLVDRHVSPSKLLDLLERTTQQSVQYTDFKFTRRPSGNVGVEMSGIAPKFNTVALQAQRFSGENMLASVIFSDLDKTDKGVTFKVNLEILRDAIAYDVANAIIPEPAAETETADMSIEGTDASELDQDMIDSTEPSEIDETEPLE